jgi:5,10-methylenetetrahydromethanopterin reductase
VTAVGISVGWSARESLERLVDLVRGAEEAGVNACWVIDSQLATRDGFTLLGILARETERIRLGPGVTNLLTRHETVIANTLSTLETIAPGRILAGIGAGDSAVFPIGLRPQRLAELEHGLRRLRVLLNGGEVEGPSGPIRLPFQVQRPPLYLAASQPKMLDLAGRAADGVVVMGPADPEIARAQIDHVARGARAAGRDPAVVAVDLWVTMAVGEDGEAVEAIRSWASAQARWLARWANVPPSLARFEDEMQAASDSYDFSSHLSLSAGHAHAVSDEFARALAIAGPPEACARRVADLVSLRPERMTFALLSGGRERRLDDLLDVWSRVARSRLPVAGEGS